MIVVALRNILYFLVAMLFALLAVRQARAQNVTIVSSQNTTLSGTGGAKLTSVACTAAAASRWTGWINVSTQRNLVLDVDFVDANASAASLDVRCETSRDSVTAADAGRDLPVLFATSTTTPAGVSRITQSTYSWVATDTTTTNPGTSSFVLYIENIPAPFIECLFTCGAGGAAADNVTVFARGVNP